MEGIERGVPSECLHSVRTQDFACRKAKSIPLERFWITKHDFKVVFCYPEALERNRFCLPTGKILGSYRVKTFTRYSPFDSFHQNNIVMIKPPQSGAFIMTTRSRGIEPLLQAPQACVLSVERRALVLNTHYPHDAVEETFDMLDLFNVFEKHLPHVIWGNAFKGD